MPVVELTLQGVAGVAGFRLLVLAHDAYTLCNCSRVTPKSSLLRCILHACTVGTRVDNAQVANFKIATQIPTGMHRHDHQTETAVNGRLLPLYAGNITPPDASPMVYSLQLYVWFTVTVG